MNQFICLIATLFSVACAAPPDWRIVGGSTASDGQFPYQISFRVNGDHGCGGTILNEEWVLTAAHCIYLTPNEIFSVVVGTNKLDAGGTTYNVSRTVVHTGFNLVHVHDDIALVKVIGKIAFGPKVQPIPLETEHVGDGEDVMLSGWGTTSLGGPTPNDLQFLPLKTITSEDCNERHADDTDYDVDSTQVCTLAKSGKGACHGDSGGPLVHQGKVAGIVSWAKPCAKGYPDVFTRVSSYIDWIYQHMQ